MTVTAELRFRRLFQDEVAARGWDMPDTVMEEGQVRVNVRPWWRACLPLVSKGSDPN